jgi:ABC-2 type transport system ATP-binding protein
MTETTIYAKDLVKQFKSRKGQMIAVDHVSLQVEKGETFGLIGPDGAGKTTLTRVILGLLSRTEGESSILGYDSMQDTYAIRERVGYIAQQFALFADLTVMENIRFFARVHSVGQEELGRRLPGLLELAGLQEFTSRQAGKLSGGMKKKLALACSLIHEPPVLMLDEPTLGVDPVSRREFWNLLGNLRAEKGLTIFVCTPYMDEAERCHRVGLMYAGRLIACDTPAAIKALTPGHLLEFNPSRFVPARDLMSGMEGVLEVQTYGTLLHVFVDDVEILRPQIEAALQAQGITWSGMREIEARMEEAFISLISRQAGAARGG